MKIYSVDRCKLDENIIRIKVNWMRMKTTQKPQLTSQSGQPLVASGEINKNKSGEMSMKTVHSAGTTHRQGRSNTTSVERGKLT